MGLLSFGADTFFAFRALRLLTTPWEKTGAFKAGLIDKDGTVIRKPETSDERSVYNLFHRLVFNLKRLLNKVPFGKKTISSYLAALYLIKESTNLTDDQIASEILQESVDGIILESTYEQILLEGTYNVLTDQLYFSKTGESFPTTISDTVIAESNLVPKGTVFGHPLFEVFHPRSKQTVLVSLYDIDR